MSTATPTRPSAGPPAGPPAAATRSGRRVRPADGDPAWTRPALWVLLAGTALLYLWDLGASGTANSYYAAAVQAGTQSWKALLFGSLDAGNAITVDKPPAALWVMALSGRVFGFSSWSMLAPQALMGVASVALVHAAVRRTSGRVAGLLAGLVLALTPAAALIFRFNNPDALLVLLMTLGAYAVVRALEGARTRWLVLAGAALGFAFLTKMGQAFLVLPAFSLAYLLFAPTGLGRRVRQLLLAGVALVVSAGWYLALVELWPASSRPYIGGSSDNSLLQLALEYNGLGRLFGGDGNGGGGGGGAAGAAGASSGATGTSFGGAASPWRLFSNEFGNEISWLLPAALVALVAGLWLTRRAVRTDAVRASLVLWGGWLLVTGAVLSAMSGTVHPYYTVALAPAIAALVGTGAAAAWRARTAVSGHVALLALVVSAAVWSFVLLGRTSSWYPALRWAVLAVALAAVLALVASAVGGPQLRRAVSVAVLAGVLSGVAGAGAFSVATAATTHAGSIPSVGPAAAAQAAGGMGGGTGGFPAGQRTTSGGTSAQAPDSTTTTGGDASAAAPSSSSSAADGARAGEGGPGAGGDQGATNSELVALLEASSGYRWAAATTGAQSAASLELASGTSVIGIGGFTGSDEAPTLAQFQAAVAAGEVRYFIAGGGAGGDGGMGGRGGEEGTTSAASQISAWVEAHFTASTVGGTTVYDLTASAG